VVGGHFAFLALEKACGGKAIDALDFLDQSEPAVINVQAALDADMVDAMDDNGPSEL
jgi:hypothetical protein